MKTLKILIVLCSFIILSSSFADDDYDNDYKEQKHEKKHISRSLEHLDLNKDQYKKIKEILLIYKKDYKKFYNFKSLKEEEIQNIMKNEIFDKEKYINIQDEVNKYLINIEVNKLKQIHDVLNSNQRRKFSYLLGE